MEKQFKLTIILFFYLTFSFGQTKRISGTYINRGPFGLTTLKIKSNGKTKKHYHNLESGFKAKSKGYWLLKNDTIVLVFPKNKFTDNFIFSDSCLLSLDKKHCAYSTVRRVK